MNNQTAGRHWRAVELDKVLRMLAEETACEDAAVLAREITPSSSLEEVRRMLAETDDAYVMMARFGAPSFGGLKNVTNALRRAEAGGTLNLTELLRIGGVLRTIRGITQWRSKSEGMKTALDWRFEGLSPINTWKTASAAWFSRRKRWRIPLPQSWLPSGGKSGGPLPGCGSSWTR